MTQRLGLGATTMSGPLLRFYTGHFLWSLVFLQGILVYFYESRGISIVEIFVLKNVVVVSAVVLQVPTGIIADRYGAYSALVIGAVAKVIGCFIIAVASDFYSFAVAYALIGAGVAFYSGTDIAVVYALQERLGQAGGPSKIIAQLSILSGASILVSTLLGGFLAAHSLDLVAWLNFAGTVATAAVFLTLGFVRQPAASRSPTRSSPERERWGLAEAWRRHRSWARASNRTFLVVGAITVIGMFMPLVSITTFQAVWSRIKLPVEYAASATASTGLFAIGTSYFFKRFVRSVSLRQLLVWTLVLTEVAVLSAAVGTLVATLVAIALLELVKSYLRVWGTVLMNDSISDSARATANSAIRMCIQVFVVVVSPAWALLLNKHGPAIAFLAFAALYLCLHGGIGVMAMASDPKAKPSGVAN